MGNRASFESERILNGNIEYQEKIKIGNEFVENIKKKALKKYDRNKILQTKRRDAIDVKKWDKVATNVRKNILKSIREYRKNKGKLCYNVKIGFTVPSKYVQTKLGRKLR